MYIPRAKTYQKFIYILFSSFTDKIFDVWMFIYLFIFLPQFSYRKFRSTKTSLFQERINFLILRTGLIPSFLILCSSHEI